MLPVSNVKVVIEELKKVGFTNSNLIIGILACVAKESGFVPKEENLNYTSIDRLITVYPSFFKGKPEEEVLPYLKNPEKLANLVYGGRYGNNDSSSGDGFLYRGRGFNQITFKDIYKKYGDLVGVDLVSHPEKLNEVPVAAKVCAKFFQNAFKSGLKTLINRYGISNPNDIKDALTGLKIAVNANAGWGKDTRNSFTEKAALERLNDVTKTYNQIGRAHV